MTTGTGSFTFKDAQGRTVSAFDDFARHVIAERDDALAAALRRSKADRTKLVARGDVARRLAAGLPGTSAGAAARSRAALTMRVADQGRFSLKPLDTGTGGIGGGSGATGAEGGNLDVSSLGTFALTYYKTTGKGQVTHLETYQDNETRKMGGYVRALNTSPDNDDLLVATAESGFWWRHTPSRDCHLRIHGVAIQTYSRQFRDLVDEGRPWHPQISNVHLNQSNYITAGLFVGETYDQYAKSVNEVGPGSAYSGDGDHSNDSFGGPYREFNAVGFADVDEVVRDGSRTLEFAYTPAVAVKANVPVRCFLGAQAAIYAQLDDVKATIRQGGTWMIIRLSMDEV